MKFLVAVEGSCAPATRDLITEAIEKALLGLQRDGVYLQRQSILTGTEEEIAAQLNKIANRE